MKWFKIYESVESLQVSEKLESESLQDGFTTNKSITKKFEELIQLMWADAKENGRNNAFRKFHQRASDALYDYWNSDI